MAGGEFKDFDSLPDPLPTDAMALAIKAGKIVLYIESTGKITGYRLDVIDALNMSYLMLGAAMQGIRQVGRGETTIPEREAFENFLGGIEVDLDKPPDLDEDDLGLFA